MKILITNDDGIAAPGLRALVKAAARLGEITVVAPKREQSGKSHGINIHDPFEIRRVEYEGAARAYAVDSTPADCVRFAILGLKEQFDLVLSGINRGYNMGEDISYSGTCGALFEAGTQKAKAIAFSAEWNNLEAAVPYVEPVLAFIEKHNLVEKSRLLNVNIPPNARGIRITRQGGPYFTDTFEKAGEDTYYQRGYCVHQNNHDLGVDTDATVDGYVTITPLWICRTDTETLEKVSGLSADWE